MPEEPLEPLGPSSEGTGHWMHWMVTGGRTPKRGLEELDRTKTGTSNRWSFLDMSRTQPDSAGLCLKRWMPIVMLSNALRIES